VVEENAAGQFGRLLKLEAGYRVDSVLKYNGLPFSVEELAEKISALCKSRKSHKSHKSMNSSLE